MRLSSVNLIANDTEITRLDLLRPNASSQYVIKAMVGIDADEIIPRFYGFSKDGQKRFYDLKLKQKEIVIRIVMNPRYKLNESVSEVRDHIYKMVSSDRNGQLELQFYAGATVVSRIFGHIVKMEVPYFSNISELQITVRCQDPMFRGINPTILEADSLPPGNPLILTDTSSTAPHGFKMELLVTEGFSEFVIQDRETNPEWDFRVIPLLTTFEEDDIIHISSEFTDRTLYILRDGNVFVLLDGVVPESAWPIMFPGANSFYLPQYDSLEIQKVSFNAAYWGV